MKNFVVFKRDRTQSPDVRQARPLSPPPPRVSPYEKRGIINVIRGEFTCRGESNNAREVYATKVVTKVVFGKTPRLAEVSSYLHDKDPEHITNPRNDALVALLRSVVLMCRETCLTLGAHETNCSLTLY